MITYTRDITDGYKGPVVITEGTIRYTGATLTNIIETYRGHDRYRRYCEVWDADTQSVRQIEIGEGYCTMTSDHAHVVKDATPDLIALAEAWKAEQERLRWERLEAERREVARRTVLPGKTVQVVKGRTNPRGTQGVVFWIGNRNGYVRVGFSSDPSDRSLAKWDYLHNVAVVDNGEVLDQVA